MSYTYSIYLVCVQRCNLETVKSQWRQIEYSIHDTKRRKLVVKKKEKTSGQYKSKTVMWQLMQHIKQ